MNETQLTEVLKPNQPEFLSDEFFQAYKYAFINLESDDKDAFAHQFTLGNHKQGQPELYFRFPNKELCANITNHFLAVMAEEVLSEGVLSFEDLRLPNGEPMRFGYRRLTGTELYVTAAVMHSVLDICTETSTQVVYENGVLQVLLPDSENRLPAEIKWSDKVVNPQAIKVESIH